MTKSQAISQLIVNQLEAGKSIQEAIDAVLGAGTYQRIAGEVYETLRAA